MLSSRFPDALRFAIEAHGPQTRKGGDVPYVAHLLAVASLVLEAGGDEDMAIAGLLHDTIEDTDVTADDLVTAFGPRVAGIVVGCTDSDEKPKPPWRQRKERYVAHLVAPSTPNDVLVVAAADKLHNARSLLADYRHLGEEAARRFNAGPADQLWYHQTVASILQGRIPCPLTHELRRTVELLREEIRRLGPARPLP
jgi:(p)ppGpp synthase/HD superfamily hydrolase